ncbi:MAG: DUF4190 domain-containing protein [Candidatus Thermoplasmatota archaeon]
MPKAKCPQCATVVSYVAGYDPICPQCGFRGEAPFTQRAAAAWSPVAAEPAPAAVQPYATGPGQPYAGRSQGMAVGALVCGILGLFIPPLALVAIILAAVAMSSADRDPQRYGGKGMAVAGLVLGILFFLFWISMLGGRMGGWWWDW